MLHSAERHAVIERCGAANRSIRELRTISADRHDDFIRLYAGRGVVCPLSKEGACLISSSRPLACRFFDLSSLSQADSDFLGSCRDRAKEISQGLFLALVGSFENRDQVSFPLVDVVSGKFVQSFFHLLADKAERTKVQSKDRIP
jgi:hypothetical protein